ncbi:MAG TPA: putative glycoside hydrolase, partial [Armatimonadota bacterium]|nr:putative glycoside hydrolase [Armatimonadota bacterium]
FLIGKEVRGYFVDVTNKEYRTFIEGIIIPRLKSSPCDGLMYDNFRTPLGKAAAGLTPKRLRELEDGLRLLLEETKSQMPAGKLLLFNGITRGGSGGERADRSLEYMKTADAGHDEYFCYIGGPDVFRPAAKVREDIDLLTKYGGENKTLLYAVKLAKSKAIKSESRLAQVKRYCYGCFLMGYVPGHGFIQFRTAATIEQGQLDGNDSAEVHLDLGMPKSAYAADGLLLKREFTKGWVFVNQDSSPREISLPADLVYGGKEFHKGDAYTIPTEDAAFFLKP